MARGDKLRGSKDGIGWTNRRCDNTKHSNENTPSLLRQHQAELNQIDDAPFNKKQVAASKKILKLESTVLKKRQDIKDYKQECITGKNKYYSQKRLGMWREQRHAGKSHDSGFRLSDQTLGIRNESRMDNDLWDRQELRGWFDKYYTPQPLDKNDMEHGGYLVPQSPQPQENNMTWWPHIPMQTPGRASPLVGQGIRSVHASNSFMQRTPPPPSPHWLDDEKNRSRQRSGARALAVGVQPAPPPWKDRPLMDEREGHTEYVPLNEIKQHHDMQLDIATHNAMQYEQDVKARCLQMNQGQGIF